jgi:hypothetical protein
VIIDWVIGDCKWLLRLCEANELDWGLSSLMQELEEAVLAIRARLPEVYDCCLV